MKSFNLHKCHYEIIKLQLWYFILAQPSKFQSWNVLDPCSIIKSLLGFTKFYQIWIYYLSLKYCSKLCFLQDLYKNFNFLPSIELSLSSLNGTTFWTLIDIYINWEGPTSLNFLSNYYMKNRALKVEGYVPFCNKS